MSFFAEDAVWDNVPMQPATGKQAIHELATGFLKDAESFSAKILRTVHEGNVIFNERIDTIAGMFELDDSGKIKVWRDYFDLNTFNKLVS
jgi:limonene-1,2-epoxide hydrolase